MFCHGDRADCPECAGTNEIPILRCPNAIVQRVHRDAVLAATQVEHGILPAAGGLFDQAATFVDALPLLLRELVHWRSVHLEREQKRAKARR